MSSLYKYSINALPYTNDKTLLKAFKKKSHAGWHKGSINIARNLAVAEKTRNARWHLEMKIMFLTKNTKSRLM